MAELNITDLDFNGIKDNIRTFLRQQDEFQDYDFEGSAFSVLIDVLAYNTYYNGYYTSVVSNELFLDTAQLRKNVILKAKQLNYTAKSRTAPYATVTLTVTAEDASTSATLSENSIFLADVDGEEYVYQTLESYTATKNPNDTTYVFDNVRIYQGILKEDLYYYQEGTENKFIVLSDNADVSTLKVFVSEANSVTQNDRYSESTNYVSISNTDKVYWVSQDLDEKYYVYFGDGIIGEALPNNHYVVLKYLETEGELTNTSSDFIFADSVGDYDDYIITVTNPSVGGTEKEDIESIRFNAPKFFQTQNRAITVSDYVSIVKSNYSNVKSINAWGGEDNVPPQYGKVFISVQPFDSLFLSDNIKTYLSNLLKKYSPVSIRTEFVDPIYTYIKVNIKLKYDSRKTNKTDDVLKQEAIASTVSYIQNNVSKYDTYFRYSKFISSLDSIDPAITSNLVTIEMKQYIFPNFTTSNDFVVFFNNSLSVPNATHRDTVQSSRFYFGELNNCYIRSIGNTLIMVFVDTNGKELIINDNIGTIDSRRGIVNFVNFFPTGSTNIDGSIELFAKPEHYDIIPLRNQIITVLESDINVSIYDDNKIILQTEEGNILTY